MSREESNSDFIDLSRRNSSLDGEVGEARQLHLPFFVLVVREFLSTLTQRYLSEVDDRQMGA